MSLILIFQLKSLIEEGGSKDKIGTLEDYIAEDIGNYVKEESFYELPTSEILKIIGKSKTENVQLLYEIVSRMSKSKGEESTLLLNTIKSEEATLEENIKILSKFEHCPICQRTSELFNDDKEFPKREYESAIEELKKENEELKRENEKLKKENKDLRDTISGKKTYFPSVKEKPYDFESDICQAARQGKLTSIQYLVEQRNASANLMCHPLHIAAIHGRLQVVKYLYEVCHLDVETTSYNTDFTPVGDAAVNGHYEVVKYLCEVCHAKVTYEMYKAASSPEIKKYIKSKMAGTDTSIYN